MTERIAQLFARLRPAKVFADIGCDHGYIALRAAESGLAETVYITDISEKCLEKAEKLLQPYIAAGRVKSVVCDGFSRIAEQVDEAMIAGMGGEEIVKILSAAAQKPERLVLQPMKNAPALRKYLVSAGYRIAEDVTFRDGKFYDVIVAERGEDRLTEEELFFGRTNLAERPQAFLDKIKGELTAVDGYLAAPMKEDSRAALAARREKLKEILR